MSVGAPAGGDRPLRFGFVVHPLGGFQRRLLGVRSADMPLMSGRPSTRPPGRLISRLQLEVAGRPTVEGVLAAIPALPEALLTDQSRGVEDVLDAVRLCNGFGASVVGLGAVTAVIGGQGKAIAEAAPCAVTSGNAMTAWAASETWRRFAELRRGPLRAGLFGLPGAVSGGILRLLVRAGAEVFAALPAPPMPLLRLAQRLNAEGPGRVGFVPDWQTALARGGVLLAASSTGGRIPLGELPAGSVVIDVAEPVDVLPDVPPREDVLLLDGEMVHLPQPLRGSEPWQTLYGWVTGQHGRVFACFAEPMLLAATGRTELATCGRELPLERLLALGELAGANGFQVDRLCEGGRPVRGARLKAFSDRGRG